MKVMRPKKRRVPTSVVVLYIVMAVVILALCGLCFWLGFSYAKEQIVNSYDGADNIISSEISANTAEVTSEVNSENTKEVPDSSAESSSDSGNDSDIPETSDNSEKIITESSEISSYITDDEWPVYDNSDLNYSTQFFKDDLFIGDSIFTGLYLYNILPQENVAAAVGYTPYKAMNDSFDKSYSGSALDYAAEKQPKHIVIMLGSNTLAAGTDFDGVVDTYKTLLKKLEKKCPDSTICVVSVPPVTADSSAAEPWDIRNENIRYVNEKLQKACDGENISFFNLYERLQDKNGNFAREYAENDGMHFKSTTYSILLSGVQELLSE